MGLAHSWDSKEKNGGFSPISSGELIVDLLILTTDDLKLSLTCIYNGKVMDTLDKKNKGLNEVQMSLLRMFNREMSYEESVEIRDLLTQHYSQKLKVEVDQVVSQKKISKRDYDKLREE